MWKKEWMKAKIERFVVSQIVLIVDGMVLMTSIKIYSRILIIFAMLVLVCMNVYDYYKEVQKSEIAEKLNEEVANKILENVENDK